MKNEIYSKSAGKVIALLPMKGHSERVPNKNIRTFAGRPLYHRIAETLESSDRIESIIINTDSDLIAEDATKHYSKVQIIMRPSELQGDFVPMNDIIGYDMEMTDGEHYLQTHSTNPLLTRDTIDAAIEKYFSSLDDHDSLFSVTRFQTRLYWSSGMPVNHDPEKLLRTQDLPPLYEENSNIYLLSKTSFKAAGYKRIGLRPIMFPIEKLEAVDIDEEIDFLLAEVLFRMRNKGRKNAA